METHPPTDPTDFAPETSGATPASSGRLRDPGNRGLASLSWFVVACAVGLIILSNLLFATSEMVEVSEEPSPTSGVLKLIGRYTVGVHELMKSSNIAAAGSTETLINEFSGIAVTRDDQLRVALIAIDLEEPETVRTMLEKATAPSAAADPDDTAIELDAGEPDGAERESVDLETDSAAEDEIKIAAYVFEDARRIEALLEGGAEAMSPEDRQALIEHHGWFAEAALTHGLPKSDPARHAVVTAATRVVVALVTLATLAGLAFVVGMALFLVMAVKLSRRRLTMRYSAPAPGGSVYIETFAIFLIAFITLDAMASILTSATGFDARSLLIWLMPLILLWPVVRGARGVEAKYALGWHRGEGFLKEIGAGLVGYLAGIPIVALGFVMTLLLGYVMSLLFPGPSAPPSHPVVQMADSASAWDMVKLYLLASVWAPLTEESMFRGALFHHLRGKLGALVSGLCVGFIFAIIHPQGILLVPPLMALGLVFALMREWRGSLIAPMIAHGLHNAILITVLLVAMG